VYYNSDTQVKRKWFKKKNLIGVMGDMGGIGGMRNKLGRTRWKGKFNKKSKFLLDTKNILYYTVGVI